jgi:hypothetical protein
MKKVILSVLLMAGAVAYATAQEASELTVPAVSNWSAGIKLGPAYAGGLDFNIGGTVKYDINPFIGVGVGADYLLDMGAFQGTGNLALNLSNICASYRTGFWQKVNFYAQAGGGLRLVNSTKNIIATAGLLGEYKLSDALSFEVSGDGYLGGTKAILANVGLRYKFNSAAKKHARNITMGEYIPKPAPVVLTETKGKDCCDQINARLKSAEQLQSTLQQKSQKLADDLNALQNKK